MEDLNLPPTIANIAAGESQTLEFKSSFDKAAIESLVAFANVQGDIVPVGVNDNGAVQGVSLGEETLNEWLGPINSASSPSVLPDLSAHIHLGRFKTPSMIIDDRQIADTPFEAVEQAMRFIVSHISVAFEINGSIHRKERFAYPLPALREALLDAVVHRDYKDGSDIQVKIFDDRISIFSPGGQFAGLQMDAIRRDNYRSRLQHQQPFRRHRELQPRIARRHPLYARDRQRIRYRSSAPDPDQQLVIAAAPNASLLDKLKSNLKEVQARCGELYVFADADSHFPETEQIQVLPLSEHYGDLSPILHVVPVQLLAYPTALAKSVTVE